MSEARERDEMDVPLAEVFKAKFGQSNNSPKERLKAERRAGRTPRERDRSGGRPLRKTQISTFQTALTKTLLEKLAEKLTAEKKERVSQADVIELAIAFFAAEHKVKG